MKLLHTIMRQPYTVSADGVETYDLPVNPLSVIHIGIRPLNDTGTLANVPRYMELCESLNAIRVLYRGQSVFSMRGRDAAALNYFRHGVIPMGPHTTADNVNNDRRFASLPIYLGRFPFDHRCCFPASKRGELTLELDVDIASTGYDALQISLETDEILGADPKEYERKAVISKTWAATGDQDFELPTGYDVRGLLLFGTTGHTGATPAPSWGNNFSLFLEGQQEAISSMSWQVAMTMGQLMGRQAPMIDAHKHIVTTNGNAETELATLAGPYDQSRDWSQWAFVDLDPTRDDTFSIRTRGASSFSIRANVGTADAVRVVPIERVSIGS